MLLRCNISTLLTFFPLSFIAFRLLLPTFHQRACITVLPPLCRMPQCHRQVIALLVARTVRHWLLTWLESGLTFPTVTACRGFDACACTPTPRDLLSSHWQLRLHLIWKVASPLYIDVRLVAHGQVSVLPFRINDYWCCSHGGHRWTRRSAEADFLGNSNYQKLDSN